MLPSLSILFPYTTLFRSSSLSLRNESMSENNESDFFTTDNQRFSASDVRNESEAEGLEGNIELTLNKKFAKRFRELDVVYQLGYTETDRENTLNSNQFFGQFVTPDSIF